MFGKFKQTDALRQWRSAAQTAGTVALEDLRRKAAQARQLKTHLDRLLFVSASRLALPAIGNQAFPKPHDADWFWRPELWCGPLGTPGLAAVANKHKLGQEVTLFHDCAISELTLRQLRNTREADLAAYGVRMDVFRFDGTYLSLAIDLPSSAAQGLKRTHLIRVETILEMETPLEIFARLNIQHGPNTEQLVRELPLDQEDIRVEFDLSYTQMQESRVEKLWLDLIFESPEMNQVILRDVTFSRRPRAAM
ncbi:MAG: DUF6478 family protein [Rhodobacteraceae bacterium]|nr:DUF6478 family protein [Paracoccaceae bacterium]